MLLGKNNSPICLKPQLFLLGAIKLSFMYDVSDSLGAYMCVLVPMCNINYKYVVKYVVTRIPHFSIIVSQCTVHTMCFTEMYNIFAIWYS